MPTLNWIGKEQVLNHHLNVPFRLLDRQYGVIDWKNTGEPSNTGNMIIHGDNLEALKALLSEYEGRVNCVFIDPPYNTGNEWWVYNDSVNDPKIQKWLWEVVWKESEDLTRHDKWLCMMYPRLRLLKKLLAEDGLIFMALDDNELENWLHLLNQIFWSNNRLACAPWLAEPSGGKEKTGLRNGHEYILIYSNWNSERVTKEERTGGELNLKDDLWPYRKGRELRKWGGTSLRVDRPGQWFPLTTPNWEIVYPHRNDWREGHWRWWKDQKMKKILEDPNLAHWELCPYDEGVTVEWKAERLVPFEKIREVKRMVWWATWLDNVWFNSDGTKDLKQIFWFKPFDTPKPSSLVEWLINLCGIDDAIILDSFAGSGTTAHAVLNLNARDWWERKFILVEMEEYAETITAERVRRVCSGYADVPGTGGGFDYYTLGETLLDENGNLNASAGAERIKAYIAYTEIGVQYDDYSSEAIHHPYFLARTTERDHYFYFDPLSITVLDWSFLKTITTPASSYTIWADKCSLDEVFLRDNSITFRKIPRDIRKI